MLVRDEAPLLRCFYSSVVTAAVVAREVGSNCGDLSISFYFLELPLLCLSFCCSQACATVVLTAVPAQRGHPPINANWSNTQRVQVYPTYFGWSMEGVGYSYECLESL